MVAARSPMVVRSLWIALVFFSWSQLAAQRPPSTPFVERGACPFECCQLGHWTARDTLPVYARQQAPETRLFLLAPGQGFVADSADFHTLALGSFEQRCCRRSTAIGKCMAYAMVITDY